MTTRKVGPGSRKESKKRRSATKKSRSGRSTSAAKATREHAKQRQNRRAAKVTGSRFSLKTSDPTVANLQKLDHIVVLMMENRSFDHMLGYLTLKGRADVDGLTAGMSNNYKGQNYPVRHLQKTALGNKQDPCHDGDSKTNSPSCVAEQLSNNNGGFVSNYARTHKGDPEVDLPMGYYTDQELPVYDHLAANFLICDRWLCSVDGATWPNRLYSLTGRAAGSKNNKTPPLYDVPTFVRHLGNNKIPWRWYAHDAATLRLVDSKFRPPLHPNFKHFSYFDRRSIFGGNSFLEDAQAGTLAAVSWIDPNFVDVGFIGPPGSNDDHPPSDITAGQELVLKLYNAVIGSPKWNKTLLIIVYDEHGGFFDHVAPPPAEDDSTKFRQYGARVPAFVISPWAQPGLVSHALYDHASIIKTILLRFCQDPGGSIPDMGARVNNANHLGGLLTRSEPLEAPDVSELNNLVEHVARWKAEVFRRRMTLLATGKLPEPPRLNELQEGIVKAKRRLRAQGLPEGQP